MCPFFLSLWSEICQAGQGKGKNLVTPAPQWSGDSSQAPGFVPFQISMSKGNNGLRACMARKPSLPDRLGFNKTLNLSIYSIVHSSIKYLSSICHVHSLLLTTGREGKSPPQLSEQGATTFTEQGDQSSEVLPGGLPPPKWREGRGRWTINPVSAGVGDGHHFSLVFEISRTKRTEANNQLDHPILMLHLDKRGFSWGFCRSVLVDISSCKLL